jgi:hypothetical protein
MRLNSLYLFVLSRVLRFVRLALHPKSSLRESSGSYVAVT